MIKNRNIHVTEYHGGDSEAQYRQMLFSPVGRLLFKKAYPTVIIQLITVIYNTADTYFVAKIDTRASAAVGVVFSLMAVIQAFGFGIGMGASNLISISLGSKHDRDANVYASSALTAGFFFGTLIMVCGLSLLSPMIRLLGASETVLPFASDYATYILIGAPFMCFTFVIGNILRSEGQSFFAMLGITTGGILNMVLDPILIFSLKMGISGAAVATMLSQIVSAVIMLSFFIRGKSIVKLSVKYVSRRFSMYGHIIKAGTPTFFRQGLASLSAVILNTQTAVYGDAAVAAISIANKLYMLVRSVVLGIGQGYQPIAGYCFGAGNNERVKKVFRLACIAGTVICTLLTVGVFVFARPIMHWFRNDAEVIEIGTKALRIFCTAIPFMAFSTYVNQTYQSLGFNVGATFLASCRQGLFFIPVSLILPRILGLTGIAYIQPTSDILTFVISVPFCIRFIKKHLAHKQSLS